MVPVQKSAKEVLVSGAEEVDVADEVVVKARVVQRISHRVNLGRRLSRTSDALHGREKQGVRAASMQQRTMCLGEHLLTRLIQSSG